MDCILSLRDERGDYYINTYITLLSVFKNASGRVNVHIIHDETIAQGREALAELAEGFGQNLYFYDLSSLDKTMLEQISKRFNMAAAYRLFALDYIEADWAIYLDSDIIVQKDLSSFKDINLNGYFVAAVKNVGGLWRNRQEEKRNKPTIDFLKLGRDAYFNSGMLFLNLKSIRAAYPDGNIFVKLLNEAMAAGTPLPYPDQDIINSVCNSQPGKILWLDDSFNYLAYKRGRAFAELKELEGKIIHYALLKPWNSFFPIHLPFWKYYAASPFAGDMFRRMEQALHSKKMEFMSYYATNPKHRGVGTAVLKSGLRGIFFR